MSVSGMKQMDYEIDIKEKKKRVNFFTKMRENKYRKIAKILHKLRYEDECKCTDDRYNRYNESKFSKIKNL